MSIIEQIKALPKGADIQAFIDDERLGRSLVGFADTYAIPSDDLIALAESHERLLKAAKSVAGWDKLLQFQELADAIAGAEKL